MKTKTFINNKELVNIEVTMQKLFTILFISLFSVTFVSAIGNTIPIQIQTTDDSGNIQTGTYEFTINISNSTTCSPVLYSNISTFTTDNRGIVSYDLTVDLPFDEQYYLCYYRDGISKENKTVGTNPYAFRANVSDYWDNLNTINSTQLEDSSGELNIKESWLTTFWNKIFNTKDTDDLTEGSTNLYDNQTWNETRATSLYADISVVDTDTHVSADNDYYLYNDSTTISFNDTRLNLTIDDRDSDTTYTNGTGISLTDTTFSIVLSYFQGLFIELTDSFGGEVSGTYDNIVLDHDALDDQYIELTDLPLANLTKSYCGNITGAVSNLCTITDTDTDTQDLSYDTATDVISLIDGGSIDITEVDTNTNCSVDDSCSLIAYDSEINKTYVDTQDSAQDDCSEISGCVVGATTNTGTVTSIATTSPISGGTITSTGTISLTACADTEIYKYNSTSLAWECESDSGNTYTGGDGITLTGTEINHTDTSSQASSENSGNTFIQDIVLDTFGHITSIVTGAVDFSLYSTKTVADTLYYGINNPFSYINNSALTDNSIANTLHRHSELVASDGAPDPALSVNDLGNVGIGTTTPDFKLQVDGDIAPETDSNSSIGSSLKRWLKGWFTDLNVENDLTVAGDIVVDGYVYSAQCPEGMAYIGNVGGYCIDKYEASMPSANSTDMGNSTEIALRNAPGTMEAQSVVGVVPWVQVSQISARIACENAGKRLCTDEEWLGASNVQGDTFNLPSDLAVAPYGCVTGASTYCSDHSYESGDACNTGYNVSGVSGCYSSEGVYDMVGNVWEWTNEIVDVVNPDEIAGWKYVDSGDLSWSTSSADDDGTYGKDGVYIPVTTSGRAVRRGGVWNDGANAGPFCAFLNYAPTNTYNYIGFRCCSS